MNEHIRELIAAISIFLFFMIGSIIYIIKIRKYRSIKWDDLGPKAKTNRVADYITVTLAIPLTFLGVYGIIRELVILLNR